MTASAPARTTRYRSPRPPGRDGFLPLLHAEWTKFRTVRGWVAGMLVAVVATVGVGLLGAMGSSIVCRSSDGGDGDGGCGHATAQGPGGEPVVDAMTWVHTALTGDGSITARVTSLTGAYAPGGRAPEPDPEPDPGSGSGSGSHAGSDQGAGAGSGGDSGGGSGPGGGLASGVEPWAKAGVIVKDGTRQGSPYAAVMATGSHGVRMQYDYTRDLAGLPGKATAASPRWLRLTRSGDTLTGYDSADGTHWTRIGAARLPGLPDTVRIGLFTTSPEHIVTTQSFGGTTSDGGPSEATAAFDSVVLRGSTAGGWTGTPHQIGPPIGGGQGYTLSGGTFTLKGSGDIAPLVPGHDSPAKTVEESLVGAFAGLVVIAVVATLSVTSEYRRGLIRTTFTAAPRRGRLLAAKAAVTAAVCFATGLVAAAIAVPLVGAVEKSKGFPLNPTPLGTELRVVLGTAALFAATGVLALGLGAVLRRSAGAVSVVIVAVVLPYLLTVGSVLPEGPSRWLARLTPAAAFSVQQTLHQYAQVDGYYTPGNGYFPLPPWGGFAVLCGYAAAALAAAAVLLRGRDA